MLQFPYIEVEQKIVPSDVKSVGSFAAGFSQKASHLL
jgi:hypothetical protein